MRAQEWTRGRWLTAGALATWTVLIGCVTLAPDPGTGSSRIYDTVAAVSRWLTGGRVVPTFLMVEGIGNVLMFVPYGALWCLQLGWPRPSRWQLAATACAISLATSTGIELAQAAFLPARYPELRDVLHNTLGGAVGAALTVTAARHVRRTGDDPDLPDRGR